MQKSTAFFWKVKTNKLLLNLENEKKMAKQEKELLQEKHQKEIINLKKKAEEQEKLAIKKALLKERIEVKEKKIEKLENKLKKIENNEEGGNLEIIRTKLNKLMEEASELEKNYQEMDLLTKNPELVREELKTLIDGTIKKLGRGYDKNWLEKTKKSLEKGDLINDASLGIELIESGKKLAEGVGFRSKDRRVSDKEKKEIIEKVRVLSRWRELRKEALEKIGKELIDEKKSHINLKKQEENIDEKEINELQKELNELEENQRKKNIRNILLVGRTGRGKSTLANVISGDDKFKESKFSVSETKAIQGEEFKESDVDYRVIDTPGIGDTRMSDNEVLNIIAEAVYLTKNGVNQIIFTIDGRFDQYEMNTYNLLKIVIFDKNITDYTTTVRTRFPDFEDEEECENDVNSMIEKGGELAGIIESCQRRVIHVDNPPIDIKDIRKLNINKDKRDESRKKILNHLRENCQRIYRPERLEMLSAKINEHMEKIEELEVELRGSDTNLYDNIIREIKKVKEIVREEIKEFLKTIEDQEKNSEIKISEIIKKFSENLAEETEKDKIDEQFAQIQGQEKKS